MAHQPTRTDVSVKQDETKGMPQTTVQGGAVNNTPKRTAVSGAREPQRTPANIPVHNMRDTGSGQGPQTKPNMHGVD